MPRARSNVPRLKRKKGIMKAGRGAFGARSKLWTEVALLVTGRRRGDQKYAGLRILR